MPQKIKARIFFCLLLVTIMVIPIMAEAEAFSIHLFYDIKAKTLKFDKTATEPVTHDKDKYVSAMEFSLNNQPGQYILKLYDINGGEVVSTEFDKQDGVFNLDIPYFSLAQNMKIFEKSSGKELLNSNLSVFSTCNGNGVCEYEKRENSQNCIGDCGKTSNTYSDETKKLLQDNNGILKDPQTGETLLQDKSFFQSNNSSSVTSNQTQLSGQSSQSSSNNQQSTSTTTTTTPSAFNSIMIIILAIVVVFLAGFFAYKKFINK